MNTFLILGIIVSGVLLALLIVAGTILMIFRMRQTGFSAKSRSGRNEEATMIQEIYNGLSGMEQRVENLEAILMEQKGRDKQ